MTDWQRFLSSAQWKRLAAIKVLPNSQLAFVIIAIDPNVKHVHLLEALRTEREVLTLQAKMLQEKGGKNIPVVHFADSLDSKIGQELMQEGLNVLPLLDWEKLKCDDATLEQMALALWELMRTEQFHVEPGQDAWSREFEGFERQDGKIPAAEFPLMAATMLAVKFRELAERPQSTGCGKIAYPSISIA